MDAGQIAMFVVLILSGLVEIVLVLMHSGKGGINDITYDEYAKLAAEKNLNRATVAVGIVFFVDILLMLMFFPQGMVMY